jgi:hypothetical protein
MYQPRQEGYLAFGAAMERQGHDIYVGDRLKIIWGCLILKICGVSTLSDSRYLTMFRPKANMRARHGLLSRANLESCGRKRVDEIHPLS